MNFRTYDDLTKCIVKNLYKVPHDIDLIVGIPRSGSMVASILALYLNLPITDIDTFIGTGELRTGSTRKCSGWIKNANEAKHVLVVDDSVSSGKAIREVKEILTGKGIACKITFLAIYSLAVSRMKVDIYFEICEQPRMFEWNYMHHWALKYCCMDIDGILCEDPKWWQNDDSEKYKNFILNAPSKFIPTQKVGKLVSGRLESYRAYTEIWLKNNHVEYDELILMDQITAEQRMLSGRHAAFKAKVYSSCDAILFFESDYDQALEICRLSGTPVFCIENMNLINSDNVMAKMQVRSKEFKVTMKRVMRKLINKIDYVK